MAPPLPSPAAPPDPSSPFLFTPAIVHAGVRRTPRSRCRILATRSSFREEHGGQEGWRVQVDARHGALDSGLERGFGDQPFRLYGAPPGRRAVSLRGAA